MNANSLAYKENPAWTPQELFIIFLAYKSITGELLKTKTPYLSTACAGGGMKS
jgi:hypothetical protein